MCYSEFNDIIAAIGAMDADVISIETRAVENGAARCVHDIPLPKRDRNRAFTTFTRPAFRPSVKSSSSWPWPKKRLAADQIWVNPDCGLKNTLMGRRENRHWRIW